MVLRTNIVILSFISSPSVSPRSNSALSTSSNVSYVSTPLSQQSQQQQGFFSSISSDLNVLASQTSYMLGDWLGKCRLLLASMIFHSRNP